jgi:flagellar assembly factor FliW
LSYSTARQKTEENIEVKSRLVTRQFGELEFDESIVYHFPNGLPGFEELHDYIVIDDKDTEPLRWLLSTEDPNVGLGILEASLIAPEIYGELPPEDRSSTAFVVVVLRRDPDPITANLKAPILLDHASKSGRQVVLNSEKFSTEHRIN